MNVIRPRPSGRPARREIAIPQGAQGFADALARRVESFVHQRPRRRRFRCHLNLRQVGHHDIGAGLAQRLRLPAAIDADDAAEAAGAPRLDAGDRVLDDDSARRFHLEAPRRLQESIGRRLAVEREAGDIRPVHPRVEELRYTGCLEHRRAVVAGGHDRGLDLLRPQRAHERDRRLHRARRRAAPGVAVKYWSFRLPSACTVCAPGPSSGAPKGNAIPRDSRKAATPS